MCYFGTINIIFDSIFIVERIKLGHSIEWLFLSSSPLLASFLQSAISFLLLKFVYMVGESVSNRWLANSQQIVLWCACASLIFNQISIFRFLLEWLYYILYFVNTIFDMFHKILAMKYKVKYEWQCLSVRISYMWCWMLIAYHIVDSWFKLYIFDWILYAISLFTCHLKLMENEQSLPKP